MTSLSTNLAQSQQEANELGESSGPSSPASKSIDNSGEKSMVAAGGTLPRPPAASLTRHANTCDDCGVPVAGARSVRCKPCENARRRAVHAQTEYVEEDRGYETPCWIWQGGTSHRGELHYGRKRWRGRSYPAHRAYYEEANECEVSPDLHLDHLCRVTLCVNPDHLEPVTPRENVRRSSGTKLTKRDVSEIKRIYSKYRGDAPNARQGLVPALSRAFGVSYRTITRIAAGEKWGDVA